MDGARRPSPGGGAGVASTDRKSRGTWCILLYPMREPATQTHSFADQLFRSLFPRIVPGCLLGGEKHKSRVWKDVNRLGTRDWNLMPYSSLVITGGQKHTHTHTHKYEKAQLRRGITLLVAMPGHLLNHLTKTESRLLLLLQTAASSGLSSTRLITFWTGAALGGRWSRLSSGFAGDAGIPEHAGVGNGDQQAGGDGEEGAQQGQQLWGVGMNGGSIVFISVVVK